MGIKSITSLALAATAVACVSVAPAEAKNNDKYLNQLAMQMYLQNQAATPYYNPYAYGNTYGYGYNPAAYNAAAYNTYNAYNPYYGNAMPYGYGNGNVYYHSTGRYCQPQYYRHHHWWR